MKKFSEPHSHFGWEIYLVYTWTLYSNSRKMHTDVIIYHTPAVPHGGLLGLLHAWDNGHKTFLNDTKKCCKHGARHTHCFLHDTHQTLFSLLQHHPPTTLSAPLRKYAIWCASKTCSGSEDSMSTSTTAIKFCFQWTVLRWPLNEEKCVNTANDCRQYNSTTT